MARHSTLECSPVVLLVFWVGVVSCDAHVYDTRFSKFRAEKSQHVTSLQLVTSTPSRIACVKECMNKDKHPLCDSCTYDKKSGTCYLQVQTDEATDVTLNSMTSYTATCRTSDAPVDNATTKVNWQRTQNGLESKLVCNDDDYVYVGDSPVLTCTGLGVWVKKEGQCKQRIWRNQNVSSLGEPHLNPVTPTAGWTLCLNGTPILYYNTIKVDLVTNSNPKDRVKLRFVIKSSSSNRITIDHKINGVVVSQLRQETNLTPVQPIVFDQAFGIKIVAVHLTTMQVYINGEQIGSYNLSLPLDRMETAEVGNAKNITLNLLCD